MIGFIQNPYFVFAASFLIQTAAAFCGYVLRPKERSGRTDGAGDLDSTQAAALTLLALLIGFSFSMAISRYDLRKNYEEGEANAIGTAYVRADLLPKDEAAKTRHLLALYIDRRIAFYVTKDQHQLEQIGKETAALQNQLWSSVARVAETQPTPVIALAVSGMNDVLNSQGYAQAAWLNRIPIEAFGLMQLMAIACNILIGYRMVGTKRTALLVLPLITSISFYLIADIDSPRRGIIEVVPRNLELQSQAMTAQ
jgi:hypothetical protein